MAKYELKSGFTTGTCAAVAAKAATAMLLTGKILEHMNLVTPKGTEADLPLFHVVRKQHQVSCGVIKDAGDDPDVTHQAYVFASVEYFEDREQASDPSYCYRGEEEYESPIYLTGGEGIGWVTRPGLSCPVGYPAINPVPRRMIFEEVWKIRQNSGYDGALKIRIWMPEGKRLAEKTFNSKLGIQGGLSILGTTGIVKPMSEDALIATIKLELHMKAVSGSKHVILTPGNYGEAFIRESLHLSLLDGVTVSNFIKTSCAIAGEEGFDQILFVGHIGKLIKVAGGVENTHSKYGDRRMEILWDCAVSYIEEKEKERILKANTMDEAAQILTELEILEPVMADVVVRIQSYIRAWTSNISVEVVTFSKVFGILGMTTGARNLIDHGFVSIKQKK
ncbi:cobalt-precorrin-5B (C(1))-methyltransferase CbiD [Clostridium sp. E02]|uniref:cobalt-precorrin-5B (C(1))-methyltransferase CbiD n=1 Tax=Clostridium sp. E02 TaxID=2487134 RepID=UPI000F53B9F9|nr:cobalt-precorrin-5B (C(1))-methyltransferase CbiD [Clostridium sp. E02]